MEGCKFDSKSFSVYFNLDCMLLGSDSNQKVDTHYCSIERRLTVEETRN